MLTPTPVEEAPQPSDVRLEEIARLLILAGRTLLESGGDISRVEETLTHMGHACAVPSVDVLCTPTGIMFSLQERHQTLTRVVSVRMRGIHLSKVAAVNEVSRALTERRISRYEAQNTLAQLESRPAEYPLLVGGLARGLSSACWALLLGGTATDFVPAMLAAFLVHFVREQTLRFMPEFLSIFFGTVVGTAAAVMVQHFAPAIHQSALIIGVIIPMVPGMALTGALRNLIYGDLLSGVAMGADAVLAAGSLAAGVAGVLSVARGLWS